MGHWRFSAGTDRDRVRDHWRTDSRTGELYQAASHSTSVPDNYLDFYTNAPLLELGLEADRVRNAKHPAGVVTYIVDRTITYTNVCVADCGFCAFYRRPKHGEGYTLSFGM